MRDRLDEFGDATVAVVTFTAVERLVAYRDHLRLTIPVVTDVDRALYRLIGAERGSLAEVFSLATLARYGRAVLGGRRLRRPFEDIRQLGADAVIDSSGVLRHLTLPTTPDSRPSVDVLVAAVRT